MRYSQLHIITFIVINYKYYHFNIRDGNIYYLWFFIRLFYKVYNYLLLIIYGWYFYNNEDLMRWLIINYKYHDFNNVEMEMIYYLWIIYMVIL